MKVNDPQDLHLAMGCSYYLFCQELKNNPLFAQRMQDAVTAGMLLLQDKVRFYRRR